MHSMRPAGEPRGGPGAVDRDHPCRHVFQIAQHCNREQFHARSALPGIVVSDRWNGYEHLDPNRRQVCWSPSSAISAATQKGLPSRRPSASRTRAHPPSVRVWRAYKHEHHDRARLKAEIAPIRPSYALLEAASPKNARNRWHRRFANNLLKVWPALWTFVTVDGIEPTNNPAERALRGPVIHRKSPTAPAAARRAVRRKGPVRRRNLPAATPLTVHLPQRTTRRPQPRRSVPRARLSPTGLNGYQNP